MSDQGYFTLMRFFAQSAIFFFALAILLKVADWLARK